MPTRTARPTRTPSRASAPRRTTGRRSNATATRRGLAGGWLQRRKPQPSRKSKAAAAAKNALPSGKSAAAAAGLALVGAVGVALRKRGEHDEQRPAPVTTAPIPSTPPVAPAVNSTPPVAPPTSADVPSTTPPAP